MGQINWIKIAHSLDYESVQVMLRDIYREEGRLDDVAKRIGVSPTSVQKKMVELGIPRVPRYVWGPICKHCKGRGRIPEGETK